MSRPGWNNPLDSIDGCSRLLASRNTCKDLCTFLSNYMAVSLSLKVAMGDGPRCEEFMVLHGC